MAEEEAVELEGVMSTELVQSHTDILQLGTMELYYGALRVLTYSVSVHHSITVRRP